MDLQISSHIDKQNISFRYCEKLQDAIPLDGDLFAVEEEMRPFPFYDQAFRLKCGGIVNLSKSRDQGARLDMGGDAFQALRLGGVADREWLDLAATFPRKKWTTRIDYAFNIHGGEMTFVEDTLTAWDAARPKSAEPEEKERCKTRFRGEPEIFDNRRGKKGMTIYYGSRKAEKLVKVYDKAAEMNLLSEAWTRVELKLDKPHSAAFVMDAADHDLAVVGRSWLLELIDFPKLDWWNFMICGDTIKPRDAREHRDKFWTWAHEHFASWVVKRACNGELDEAEAFSAFLAESIYNRDCK